MSIVVPTLETPRPTPTPAKRSRRQGLDLPAILIPLIACLYVGVVILLPALSVVASAFAKGVGPFLENFQSHELLSALRLTLFATAVAVPCNVIFGLAAATALIFGAAYTLWMFKRVYLGPVANDDVKGLSDINAREFLMLTLLALAVLYMGVYPKPFTDVMDASVLDLLKHVAVSKLN
jgi:NADH:ubiquinone oxidoreductase subunit 4 (subunit M)